MAFCIYVLMPILSGYAESQSIRPITDQMSVIEDFPMRRGVRPIIARHVVPQRQLSQIPDESTTFNAFYQKIENLLKIAPSLHETRGNILFLADQVTGNQPIVGELLREVAHSHKTGDHSLHVALPPKDCTLLALSPPSRSSGLSKAYSGEIFPDKKVIQAGWG
ncbi:uncharacterized protein A1O5_12332 [Cladophialophora psammophila CBS 110553]|uniref:Uncharacterized protein n=1 Tax=Cladophialophora psammophila CBS 110553 TaxID=1182543 RepID=W9WGY6_9EURO|nr:uncharacterized protein A1O5_12332 [Cladophialophora psammophila CBS 110553]EXJ57774.1 hypothetical protein A1O5_12332 [Cladophialophora psammophila CBS 110553]